MTRDELIAEVRRSRRQAEETDASRRAMAREDELYRTLFAVSPVGMSVCDATGQCFEANDAIGAQVGATREAVLAQNYRELESWRETGLLGAAQQAMATGEAQELRVALTSSFGEPVEANVRVSPFPYEGERCLLFVFDDLSQLRRSELERERLIAELREALHEVETLRTLVPQCCFCHRIRDDEGQWRDVAVYLRDHLGADVSHTMCPECVAVHYP